MYELSVLCCLYTIKYKTPQTGSCSIWFWFSLSICFAQVGWLVAWKKAFSRPYKCTGKLISILWQKLFFSPRLLLSQNKIRRLFMCMRSAAFTSIGLVFKQSISTCLSESLKGTQKAAQFAKSQMYMQCNSTQRPALHTPLMNNQYHGQCSLVINYTLVLNNYKLKTTNREKQARATFNPYSIASGTLKVYLGTVTFWNHTIFSVSLIINHIHWRVLLQFVFCEKKLQHMLPRSHWISTKIQFLFFSWNLMNDLLSWLLLDTRPGLFYSHVIGIITLLFSLRIADFIMRTSKFWHLCLQFGI